MTPETISRSHTVRTGKSRARTGTRSPWRPFVSEVATRSLLPTTRGNVLLAILLVIVEMTLAAVAGLSMLPFLAVAVLFLTVIMAVVRREDTDPKMAARLANFVTLIAAWGDARRVDAKVNAR